MKLVTTLASLYNTAGSATSYAAKTRIFLYKTVRITQSFAYRSVDSKPLVE